MLNKALMNNLFGTLKLIVKSIESSTSISFIGGYDEFISVYNRIYNSYKTIIENYDNHKLNSAKENYIREPHFTLHIIKNRTTTQSITAQVKWVFPIKGSVKKLKHQSIHIGTTKQFGTDLESEELITTAKIKIRDYFSEKSPFTPIDIEMLNQNMEFTELFDKLRNYIPRIKAELDPEFYVSKVANKSSYKSVVANIKWGFPYPGRTSNPRYISFYLGSESEITEDIKSKNFKEKIKPKVVDFLRDNLYKSIPKEKNNY